MFKPLTRSNKQHRPNGEFAETTFVHAADDDDYSGFAPTEMFGEEDVAPLPVPASADAARVAATTSRSALERAASASAPAVVPLPAVAEEPAMAQSWVTSQWVAAQEAKAHEAANHARAVIAAQRRADEQAAAAHHAGQAETNAPRTGLARLRAAFGRLLPGEFRSLLPLFIGVTVTVALISAVLPLIDKL